MQMNIPYVTEAQVGFLAEQSKHNYEGKKSSCESYGWYVVSYFVRADRSQPLEYLSYL